MARRPGGREGPSPPACRAEGIVVEQERIGQQVERVRIGLALDPYLSLKAAAGYTGLSVSTLRGYLQHADHPLPHYRPGGKVLIRVSELDRWLLRFRSVGRQDLDKLVHEISCSFVGVPAARSNRRLGGPRPKTGAGQGLTACDGTAVAPG